MGQSESVIERLRTLVDEYEAFGKLVAKKPTADQLWDNGRYERRFKQLYAEAITGTTSNSAVEDLLTRYKRVQLRIYKLANPEVYSYEVDGN